ncbi:hypothetical protein [Cupriavidus sp. D384]|uniref:hypothetical protein n=1 Tax=Cupriavidus sp. D384 TaxID=1538095 RepID=UPI00082D9A43|nr:hypothetical protein [Cupriavidus sp. D384]
MSITDRGEAIAQALEDCANQNATNNSGEYVGGRYGFMYGSGGYPVPVRPGAITPLPGRLFPASHRSKRDKAYEWWIPRQGGGIIAPLRDENTGEIADYRIETTGNNGVWVTESVTG